MSEPLDQLPGGPGSRPRRAARQAWLAELRDRFRAAAGVFHHLQVHRRRPKAFAATAGAIKGTIAFMAAILVAMGISKWKLGRISPMLWMSGILVIGFGALTVYLHDPKFIVMKPTIIYAVFAPMLPAAGGSRNRCSNICFSRRSTG